MKETIKQIKISENDILTWFKKIGQEAEEKGLTEELLDKLLADEPHPNPPLIKGRVGVGF